MDWNEFLKQLLINLSQIIILGGFAQFILKKYIDFSVEKDLKTFQSGLDREIKEFEIKLNRKSSDYQFAAQKRTEILHQLFCQIVNIEESFQKLSTPFQEPGYDEKEISNIALMSAREFKKIIRMSELYLNDKLINEFNNFERAVWTCWMKFQNRKTIGENGEPERYNIDNWKAGWDIAKNLIPDIKKEIRKEMQKVMQINEEK